VSPPPRIWTVGHSTLPPGEFLALLAAQRIELLADVRRFPSSRRHPQFNRDALAAALAGSGIAYLHFPELGGRREPKPDSRNTAWREAGFRGYADYMETGDFSGGIERLLDAARSRRTAIMCAEKAWQNCHRGLIADFLKASGVEVIHIVDATQAQTHPWTSTARLVDGRLRYWGTDFEQQLLF
jgi:uncharacterized protein (DUF488 family)